MSSTPPEPVVDVDRIPSRTFATLGAGELVSRLIGFAGTIYVARNLGVEMYGVIGLGFAVFVYGGILADCGLDHTGPREVVNARERLARLVWSMLVTRTAAAVLIGVILLAGSALFLDGVEQSVLAVYSLALLPVGLNLRWVHLGLERAGIVAFARVLAEGAKLAGILLLVHGPADVVFVPVAQVLGDALAAAVLWAGLPRGTLARPRFDTTFARLVLRRALPMLVSSSLATVIYNSDQIFLRVFRGAAEVGRYLAAYTLLNFLGILGHMLTLSLTPAFTRLRAAPDQRQALFRNSLVRAFAAGLPVGVGAALAAPLIIQLVFGAEYRSSALALAVLTWVLPIVLYRSVMQAALVGSERSSDVLRTTSIAAIVNVGLNFVAVPLFGMMGAAATTVIAEGVRAAVARSYALSQGFSPPNILRYGHAVSAALAMTAVLLLVRPTTLWIAVPLGTATYVTTLVLTGGLRVDRSGIRFS